MKKLLLIGVLFFSASIFCMGCSLFDLFDGPSGQMNQNAEQLAAKGASSFMDEDYTDAIKAYTDLKDWYPFSKYAILAELKIADAHFHLEQYDEAIMGYNSFEEMHPRNEAVPYVINQIGLCWFKQIDTIDRDDTPAKNAMAQFHRLADQYPGSEYAKGTKEHIKKCLDNIIDHELAVANFYYRTKKYKSALKRYEYIVEFFPGTEQSKSALNKIPKCTELANKTPENDN